MKSLSARHYILIMVFIMVTPVLLGALMHYSVDRWGIFSKDYRYFLFGTFPNRHFLKTKYVLEDKNKYNCFVFGSSRVGAIDAGRLGDDCYNFTFAGAVPAHYLNILELIEKNGTDIKRVYIALDDISYTWDSNESKGQYLRRPYPDGFLEWVDFYFFYLVQPIKFFDFRYFDKEKFRVDAPGVILDQNSMMPQQREEALTYLDMQDERDSKMRRLKPTLYGKGEYVEDALEALQKISDLAQQSGFELVLFFNPHHYKTFLARDQDVMSAFKVGVAKIQTYTDFSGINDVTRDNRYWLDPSHYSVVVGDAMTNVLMGKKSHLDDFEKTVTADNVDAHITSQFRGVKNSLKSLMRKNDQIVLPKRVVALIDKAQRMKLWDSWELALSADQHSALQWQERSGSSLAIKTQKPKRHFFIENLPLQSARYFLVSMTISAANSNTLRIHFEDSTAGFAGGEPVYVRLQKGRNEIYIPVFRHGLGSRMKVIIEQPASNLVFDEMAIEELF